MSILPAPVGATHELPGVRFTTLASPSKGSRETSVWHVEVHGHADAVTHQVTREEIFVALEGEARATLDHTDMPLHAGETLVLAPGVDSLVAVGDAPFRAIVCLPVGGQAVVGEDAFTPPWAL
jgi:quercetin dioxygenase-like cupin family protein